MKPGQARAGASLRREHSGGVLSRTLLSKQSGFPQKQHIEGNIGLELCLSQVGLIFSCNHSSCLWTAQLEINFPLPFSLSVSYVCGDMGEVVNYMAGSLGFVLKKGKF